MSYAQWNPSTTYVISDIVEYAGFIYTATVVNQNVPPQPTTATWTLSGGSGGGGLINSITAGNTNVAIGGTATNVVISGTLQNLTSNVATQNFAFSGNAAGNPSFVIGGGEEFKVITTDLTPHIIVSNAVGSGVQLGNPAGYGGLKVIAPTVAVATTSDTQVATTEFVQNAIIAGSGGGTLQSVVNAGNGISNYVVGSTATIQSTNFTSGVALTLNGDASTGATKNGVKMISNADASKYVAMDFQNVNLNGTDYSWSSIVSGVASVSAGTNINLTGTATNPVVNVNTAITSLTANPVSADSKLLQFNRTIEATTSPQSVPAPTYPKETATLINNSSSVSPIQPFFSQQGFRSFVPLTGGGFIAGGDQVAVCSADGLTKTYYSPLTSGYINCILPNVNGLTYFVGLFTFVDGVESGTNIMAFNGTNFLAVNGIFNSGFVELTTIAYDGTYLYTSDTVAIIKHSYVGMGTTWSYTGNSLGLGSGGILCSLGLTSFPAFGFGNCVVVGGSFIAGADSYVIVWDGVSSYFPLQNNFLDGAVYSLSLSGSLIYVGGAFTGYANVYYSLTDIYQGQPFFAFPPSNPVYTIGSTYYGGGVSNVGELYYGTTHLTGLTGTVLGYASLTSSNAWISDAGNFSYQYPVITNIPVIFNTTIPIVPSGLTSITLPANGDTVVLQASADLSSWYVLEQPAPIKSIVGGTGISVSTTNSVATITNTGLTAVPNLNSVLTAGNSANNKTILINDGGATVNLTSLSNTGVYVNNFPTNTQSRLDKDGTYITDLAGNIAYGRNGITKSDSGFSITTAGQLSLAGATVVAPTVSPATDSSTKIATTAFVQSAIAGSVSGVSSFSAGTTGLTPSTATTGAVVLSGTLAVANGGTGVITSTGTGSTVLSISPALTGNPTAPTQTFGFRTTGIANTLFVSDAIRNVLNNIVSASPVNLLVSSTPYLTTTGSLSYVVNLPDATTLQVGRIFYINNNTNAVGNTITINNFAGATLVSNGQQGSSYQFILLTNSTTAGTWDIHSYLPTGANFGTSGLVYQGNLTFTGSGTSTIAQSGSGTLSITAPTLTGVPLAPTAVAGTNTTQIATTAFVQTAVAGATIPTYNQVLNAGATATSKTATINDGGTNSTAVSATSITATTSASSNAMIGASNTITTGVNNTVFNATGFTTNINGTNQIVALGTTPSIIVGAGSNTSAVNNGIINLNSTGSGYTNAPQFNIISNNNTAGSTVGVPSITYYKGGRNAVADDLITSQHFYARNYAGTKTEFARMEVAVRNTGVGNDDGSIGFLGLINGVETEFFRMNGADSENNMFLNMDMNGNSIKTTAGNLTIDASTSSGTGTITALLKAGGNLIFTNLPTASAGLPAGAVWRNGTVLNIV